MRRTVIAVTLCVFSIALPEAARADNGQVQGFGGMTFGDVTSSTTFGGSVAIPLGGHVQIVAEGGRLTNVVPSLLGTIDDFVPIDFGISGYYGEAGIRLLGSSHRAVRPYAEATAGFARLRTNLHGTGADPIVNAALGLFDRNEPLFGLGGGVMLQGGPMVVDLGYRYKKIMAGDSLQGLITGGDISVNQVRVGVGVRF